MSASHAPSLDAYTLPDVQRRPLAEVRALQDRLLARMVELCYEHHPYYSKLMRSEGLRPEHIRSVEDLVRLPPCSKTEFLADPEAFRMRPDGLPGHEGLLCKIVYTTGTTSGRPAPIFVTAHDNFVYQYLFKDRQDLIGLRNSDRIANLFPMTAFPMGAYSRAADDARTWPSPSTAASTRRWRRSRAIAPPCCGASRASCAAC